MPEIQLRPYQKKFIDDIRERFKSGYRAVCGVAPCGSGKTIMTGWMARETAQNGKRVLFMVHRKELIDQTSKTFTDLGIPHSIIASGVKENYEPLVQIASVQTLIKRLDSVPRPDLLICDECHHILAKSYKEIIGKWQTFLLGVTATPLRLGGITLNDVFKTMVNGPSVGSLIKQKNLTNFVYFAPKSNIDYSKLRSKFGEYLMQDMSKMMDRQAVIGDAVESYKTYAYGKQAIVYCVNVKHSYHTAELFNMNGIKAAHVDGDTSKTRRKNVIDSFRRGDITVLCNAELFGEGFDVPNCECIILTRPTQSLTLFIQQAMRGMRPDETKPNKVAIIIDHVDNVKRFGLPDEDHVWTLDPNEAKEFKSPAPTKKCPSCHAIVYLGTRICPHCDYEFEFEDIKEESGSIVKYIDTQNNDYSQARIENQIINAPEMENLTLEQRTQRYLNEARSKGYKTIWVFYKVVDFAHTLDDFKIIAKCLNYQPGWAWHQWQNKLNANKPAAQNKNISTISIFSQDVL